MSRRVLVTGASRGIGRAIAYKLAADGFAVSVHCRTGRSEADAVATGIAAQGGTARVLQFDVRERAACREALEADVAAHGPYYGIVCSAGVTRDAAFPALTEEDWDVVIETGLDAFYNVVRVKSEPGKTYRPVRCRVCRGALAPTDGDDILKYFLVHRPSNARRPKGRNFASRTAV